VRGKEGFSLGTCSARASRVSNPWVARALLLYNYLLRFHLTSKAAFCIIISEPLTICKNRRSAELGGLRLPLLIKLLNANTYFYNYTILRGVFRV
jgi:hypothetical protein